MIYTHTSNLTHSHTGFHPLQWTELALSNCWPSDLQTTKEPKNEEKSQNKLELNWKNSGDDMGFCGILGCLRHEYYWIFTLVNDLVGKPITVSGQKSSQKSTPLASTYFHGISMVITMAHWNRWFTVLKNGWIFHGELLNYQRVLYIVIYTYHVYIYIFI